jgi:DNA modification methylase
MADGSDYRAFLEAKVTFAASNGIDVAESDLSAWLKPVARRAVRWMLLGGCRAIFASFGLHKTSMQLEACWRVLQHLWTHGEAHARGLIVVPLGVKQEFFRDAGPLCLNIPIRFVQTTLECWAPGLYVTNYECFRDGKIDLSGFDVVSLDEAAVLRGMGGTKTFRVAANELTNVRFKFVATATPSPNEFIELLAYAEVLGVMDIGQAKTRFFKRNSEKADELTLHPHKEREFWMWVASWALMITRPSDIGLSDEGYVLPPMSVTWHEIPEPPPFANDDEAPGGGEQGRLFRETKISVVNQARVKRASMIARIAKAAEICGRDPEAHRIIWHDLNDERDLIAEALPGAFVLDGGQDPETKEARILGFADGFFQYLAAKPVMAGAGCNFQRHCHKAVFAGIGFKFHDFIQAIHRILRFGQGRRVEIDVVYAEAERGVRDELERRWAQHNEMVGKMTEIIREFGLSSAAMADQLRRSLGVERVEARGSTLPGSDDPAWWLINNDCVDELRRMPDNSVDLIVTSIPFSNLYEYSPNYADFGHTDNNAHFWAQMDFLIPELLRVLKPGRNACIHVKDRIVYGKVTGLGFETLEPFSDECRFAFRRHGFGLLGTIYSITDVVRENNQTYRLSHSVQLRDGTRHGVGVPEQMILLRKPTSDPTNGWADQPVAKKRPDYVDPEGRLVPYDREIERGGGMKPVPETGYSRGRWQLDAHSLYRSSGDRLLTPEEWVTDMNLGEAEKLWKAFDLDQVYDYEQHVLIGERFEAIGALPAKFFLLPPQSWSASIWTDVLQMRSLNTDAFRKGSEAHICPLPFDIVNRLIEQRSEPGELVFDPFAGIGTVPYCALKLGRRGAGVELAPHYWAAAAKTCALAEDEAKVIPTLFDALEAGAFDAPEEVAA